MDAELLEKKLEYILFLTEDIKVVYIRMEKKI